MIADIIRAIIQRIFRDKILMGLIIIGVIAVFMTGSQSGQEPPVEKRKHGEAANAAHAPNNEAAPISANKSNNANASLGVEPSKSQGYLLPPADAADFVTFWLQGSMDYHRETASKSHEEALLWMTEEARHIFRMTFWDNEVEQGVNSGTIVAAYQPISVQATAVNPDGSVVVNTRGTLVMQYHGQPSTQQLITDYLVTKHPEGLKISGIYNRTLMR